VPKTTSGEPPARGRGRPPRTEQQRAAERARLIEAAMNAIRRGGPELSIDELAAAAGVSKPVLYDEFGGKLGLADAVALVLAEHFQNKVIAAVVAQPQLDVGIGVRAAVRALITLISGEPELYAFLVRSLRQSDRGFLDNALVRVMHDRATLLVRLAAPDVDLDTLAVLTDGLFGFLFAAVESWHGTGRPAEEDLVEMLARQIQLGIQEVIPGP
jgi:AcrR family transcriptional regulator